MRLILSLLAVVFLAHCSAPADPSQPEYWFARLDDKQQRSEALTELGKLGNPVAIPEIVKWFDEEGDWQPDAAYALGQLGDPSVVPTLIQALDYQVGTGSDPRTRRRNRINLNIARALAELKAKDGVEPLIKLLETPELKTREAVITSLGKIGDKRATAPLADIALNEKQPFIRKTAVQALGNLGDPAAVPALIQNLFVELPGTSFYFEARYSLIQTGQGAVPLLIDTLKRKNAEVEAIRTPAGEPVADGAVEAKAAFVLGMLRASEAETLMLQALDNYYRQFKKASDSQMFAGVIGAVMELCYALGNMGSTKAVPLLTKIAGDTDPNIRVSATEALTAIGAKNAVPALLKAAASGPAAARNHAVVALSRLGDGGIAKSYDALAKNAELTKTVTKNRPRLTAAEECKSDAACWKKKLSDADALVRERAAWELGWSDDAAAIPDLLKAAEDEENGVRMAAVSSLNRFNTGVEAETLDAIFDKWKDKITYKDSNAGLRRLAARLNGNKGNK